MPDFLKAPLILVAFALLSVVVTAVAAGLALQRPSMSNLTLETRSRLVADYSADALARRLEPLNPDVIRAAADDESDLMQDSSTSERLEPLPTATPSPFEATATLSATPGRTPTASPTVNPTASPTTSATPPPTATRPPGTSTPGPSPTVTPQPTSTPQPTFTPRPLPTLPLPTATLPLPTLPLPTATLPLPTATPPPPTSTPAPTNTPQPTATPDDDDDDGLLCTLLPLLC
jgi:Flp pilus assembly protein TadG